MSKVINNSDNSDSESFQVSDSEQESNVSEKEQIESVKPILKTPTKRKSKKEHLSIIKEKIQSITEKENKLKEEISNFKQTLNLKEKEKDKLHEDKNKLIELLFNKITSKESKSDKSDKSNNKSNTGFSKPKLIPKILHTYLKLNEETTELSMTEIVSLLSKKLINDGMKDDKKYIFNNKTLKELKLTIDNVKSNISQNILPNIEFNEDNIKIAYKYLQSFIKLLYI